MRQNLMSDAEHWRRCAEQARAQADRMETERRRQMMLRIARDYDGLATHAAKKAREPGLNNDGYKPDAL